MKKASETREFFQTNVHISDEVYTHVKKRWQTSNLKLMDEYHDLYLNSDIRKLQKDTFSIL